MAFAYTNRKGRTFYLHRRRTKAGKSRHVFARTLGAGELDEVPAGYEVKENVNGVVSLAMARPQLITDLEKQAVQSAMAQQGTSGRSCASSWMMDRPAASVSSA